jgi:hypothetical protein
MNTIKLKPIAFANCQGVDIEYRNPKTEKIMQIILANFAVIRK